MNAIRLLVAGLVATCLLTSPALAKVYRFVQPDGTVVYSDTPPPGGAEEVKLPEIQLYSPPALPAPGATAAPDEPEATGYTRFEVRAPGNDETLRDNGGTVQIALSMEPALQDGHEVEIFVDGTSVGRGRATTASLTNVDRGSHTVYAVVRDNAGDELARTSATTFHLKRTSRLNRPGG